MKTEKRNKIISYKNNYRRNIIKKNILFFSIFLYMIFVFNAFSGENLSEASLYKYLIRPGDTIGMIVSIFMERPDFEEIMCKNNIQDLNKIYPGQIIEIDTSKPVSVLKRYLSSIYNFEYIIAYELLSSNTRSIYPLSEFKKANDEMTFYNVNSLKVVNDFLINNKRILCIEAQMEEDPASWVFSIVWESNNWRVMLNNLRPTFPISKCSE